MAQSETDQMADVRIPIGVAIVLQVIIAAAYIIPIESDPALSTGPRFRLLEAALYLSPLLTLALYSWRPQVQRWFAVLAPAAILFALQSLAANSRQHGAACNRNRAGGGAHRHAGGRGRGGGQCAWTLCAARDGRRLRRLADRDRIHCYRDHARPDDLGAARGGQRRRLEPQLLPAGSTHYAGEPHRDRARCSRRWRNWHMPTGR